MIKKFKILHNVSLIGKSSFGLGQISVSLASSQYLQGHDVGIWCTDTHENIRWASENHGFPVERITGFNLFGPRFLWFSPELTMSTKRCANDAFEIIHQHGIWTGTSNSTRIFAKEKKIPAIIAPHGSLNQIDRNLSRWKKKIALTCYENENLRQAACLHATSENEVFEFRNFGLKNPIAYMENGIHEKNLCTKGNAHRFREKNAINEDKRLLLYMGRITPKKGLLMLVNAIKTIQADFHDWNLIIIGNDEFNHKKEVESLIKNLNLQESIMIIGPQFNEAKNDAFEAADLFILPSFSEGSPMVILDSLASGVPVITTKASGWSELASSNCGWLTEANQKAISEALKHSILLSREHLKEIGENGKNLIASKYVWTNIAKKTISLYSWLLNQGDKPDFVQID